MAAGRQLGCVPGTLMSIPAGTLCSRAAIRCTRSCRRRRQAPPAAAVWERHPARAQSQVAPYARAAPLQRAAMAPHELCGKGMRCTCACRRRTRSLISWQSSFTTDADS